MGGVTQPTRASISDVVVYLLAVAGLATSISLIWLTMRSVLDIGGFCAEGGPYVIQYHCPEGAVALLTLAFPGLFLFTGLMFWRGSRLGRPFAGLAILMWPALFLSLGWNFLEYSFPSAQSPGFELGWLVPGIIFVLMGLAPLYIFLPVMGMSGKPDPQKVERLRLAMDRAQRAPPSGRPPVFAAAGELVSAAGASSATDLVSQLERLAALRATGALSEGEYESAKRALIENPATGA